LFACLGAREVAGTLAALLVTLALGAPAAGASKPVAASSATVATPEAAAHDTSTRKAMVIEGDNHMFMVSAPDGWVLDDTAGMGSRIRCVFYPKGQKWATAATVMYVNPLHGYGAKTRTVSTLIAEDEKSFKKNSPRGKVTDGGTIQTTGKKTAVVRYFSIDGGPAHEAVAYVPEAEMVMLLVLSSKTPQGFQGALAAYRELVQSYAWVASNAELGR
jgi:hypothetical protein